MRLFLTFLAVVVLASVAEAGPFRNRYQRPASCPVPSYGTTTDGGLAQAKAEQQAREGRMRHVGGSFGSGRFEGVGFSSVGPDDAIRRFCYYGQRPIAEQGVARGANGWYACVLYY